MKNCVFKAVALAVLFASAGSILAREGKPNILFVIADDLADRLACYGDPVAVTPNLDALAERGGVFRNTYCQYHTCGPSRASLMSGRYPFETGYTHAMLYDLEKDPRPERNWRSEKRPRGPFHVPSATVT